MHHKSLAVDEANDYLCQMQNKLFSWDDTIIALATPPGIGAIGILRLSGKEAITIIKQLFHSKDLSQQASHTLHVGLLKQKDKVLDEVVVSLFKGPRSYTGEDVVEISCHGSPYVQEQVMHACTELGARLAKPGEFTLRAFIHGRLDLTQAEAVADLIAANTSASHKTALHNIRGGFSEELKLLREQLIQFSSLIELELDFATEDVEFADRHRFNKLIENLQDSTTRLLESFRLGNVIRNGVSVAIIGRPNAGKSTLLNTLLNENRAIVSEIAGTTRDTIEEVINIDGIIFRLIDTAGIRDHSTDVIETIGIERSMEKMKNADLVLYIFDVATTEAEELRLLMSEMNREEKNYLLIGNKADLMPTDEAEQKFASIELIFISAKENKHINILKERLVDSIIHNNPASENTIVTNARHYEALLEVKKSLTDIHEGLENNLPGDLLSLDIRRCLHYLGEITGEVTNDDRLDYIFSKFCIGK